MSLFADQTRDQLRGAYREAWRKWRTGLPLQPLEAQIADVIGEHPEYQSALQEAAVPAQDFPAGAENPFLHMGLHLAVREQVATDRPAGIALIHQQLASRYGSRHAAEHGMIEVLAALLSQAQRSGLPPQEDLYLEQLRRL